VVDEIRTWRDRACGDANPFICDLAPDEAGAGPTLPDGCTLADVGKPIALCATPATFDTAIALCEGVGGALLRVESRAQNLLVHDAALPLFPATPGVAWVGARRDAEGAWAWLADGAPIFAPPYSPWEANAPDGGSAQTPANCLEMGLQTDENGAWNDRSCDEATGFVCQAPAVLADGCTIVEGTVASDGGSYFICTGPLAYDEAQAFCEDLGGALARIDARPQQIAVRDAAVALAIVADILLGADDRDTEGVWAWRDDGTVFDDLR
jgi:hypothetical protein